MIKEISIKNFRSIYDDKITFEPLTVLIGANGSGKSNLIKALEFISGISKDGIDLACSKQGGREGIVSKIIPKSQFSKNETSICYEIELFPVREFSEDRSEFVLRPVCVEHKFSLLFKQPGNAVIQNDSLKFKNAFGVAVETSRDKDSNESPFEKLAKDFPESTITIIRDGKGSKHFTSPKIDDNTLEAYSEWFGFNWIGKKFNDVDDLEKFLRGREKGRSQISESNYTSNLKLGTFIDPDSTAICENSPQFGVFKGQLDLMKRFDFLMNELRIDQAPTSYAHITKSGSNLPSAIRRLKKENLARVASTFEAIAPHILKMRASTLQTGKEFVEFIEHKTGRKVESWESSDGSLRALAILVALEAAQENSIIMIEEPEVSLHPWAVRILLDHIREVVVGRKVQVILTTHSEHVLEKVLPDEVRVVSRSQENGSKFLRLDQILPGNDLIMGEVGKLWVDGMLGGVPEY